MQKMMIKEIERKVPRLYETDGQGRKAMVYAHYFSCVNGWDWYMTEYDPETRTAFGWVRGLCGELGYFNLGEFDAINREHGREVIEREVNWEPTRLERVMQRA